MSLTKELQRIYDSEINFSMEPFWDGGVTIKIGDELNGFKSEYTEPYIESAIFWLIAKTIELYPTSLYSYCRLNIINKIREGLIDTEKFTPYFLQKLIEEFETKNPDIYSELENKWYQLLKERTTN